MINPNKQHGAALIVALFVVAMVAIAATLMIDRLRTDIRRTELTLNASKADLYAHGSLLWAIDQLNNNYKQKKQNQLIDKTPIQSPVDHQHDATIVSVISDAQGNFNINNLIEQTYSVNFLRLLMAVAPELDGNQAQLIALAVVDWISTSARDPALDEYYLKSTPSYRAPHRPMISISELRLVKGMTPEIYAKIAPYLTALPQVTPININNAAAPIILCLSMNMSAESAKSVAQAAQKNPFATAEKFLAFDLVKNANDIDPKKITVASNYFLVQTNVKLGQQQLTQYTMLERAAQTMDAKTLVLWQSKGTL